ncbi:MAG: hypothetical protein NT001_02940 [Candidatus Woesearchaeota archaeon]|nr:hypothetical protein [Candidatus Woesearchaeota archaeon]
MQKSQVSLEYLLITGFIFVIIIPIFYYSLRESTEQIRLNQAEDAVITLAKTADSVYALGPGSRDYVEIMIPPGVTGYIVNDTEVSLIIGIGGASSEISYFSQAMLTGSLPTTAGAYTIPVETLESGIVQIGAGNDTMPPVILYTYPNGRINFNDITIKANTNEPALCKYDAEDIDYASMDSVFVGSLMGHEIHLGVLDDGNYISYARCIDASGNVMHSSAIINFTINTTITGGNQTNGTYEPDPPIITLIAPPDNSTDSDGIVLFQYNATDASTIAFCKLILNNTVEGLVANISKTGINNMTNAGIDYGRYNWSINCTDVHGNEGASSTRKIFINYVQDHDVPVVYLMSPANSTTRNNWLVKFAYNVTDQTSAVSSCTLHMNGTMDTGEKLSWDIVDQTISENSAESITIPLFRANYTWQMSCIDNSYNANTGYSEKRNIRINVTAGGEAFINSCPGWCGWQGLSNGLCAQTPSKCDNNCGLPNSPSCYSGSSVSAQYCLGGSQANTCCCIL